MARQCEYQAVFMNHATARPETGRHHLAISAQDVMMECRDPHDVHDHGALGAPWDACG